MHQHCLVVILEWEHSGSQGPGPLLSSRAGPGDEPMVGLKYPRKLISGLQLLESVSLSLNWRSMDLADGPLSE